jgi:hypothetical protein
MADAKFLEQLRATGWKEGPHGWYKPARASVGAVEGPKPKPDQGRKGQDPKLGSSSPSMVYRIGLCVVSNRELDAHDNLRSACKPLVDAITASLGYASDSDARLRWEYGQLVSNGRPGVIVSIAIEPVKK